MTRRESGEEQFDQSPGLRIPCLNGIHRHSQCSSLLPCQGETTGLRLEKAQGGLSVLVQHVSSVPIR